MFSTLAMRKVFNLIGIDPHRHRIDIGSRETRLFTLFTYYLSLFLWHNVAKGANENV